MKFNRQIRLRNPIARLETTRASCYDTAHEYRPSVPQVRSHRLGARHQAWLQPVTCNAAYSLLWAPLALSVKQQVPNIWSLTLFLRMNLANTYIKFSSCLLNAYHRRALWYTQSNLPSRPAFTTGRCLVSPGAKAYLTQGPLCFRAE